MWSDDLQEYPSLCFALGRELSLNGFMHTDIESAYQFLRQAEAGYKRKLRNGEEMYQKSYSAVCDLMADSQFDEIRDRFD